MDYKADLYSLGICFWMILFGLESYPFSQDSQESNTKDKIACKLNFPENIKEEWKDFFMDVLNPNPEDRMDGLLFFNHVFFNEFEEGSFDELMGKED